MSRKFSVSHLASTVPGTGTWRSHEHIGRHRHAQPYAAIVLSGGYLESGSVGRYRVSAGQVLLHRPFDAHFDCFASAGARVLNVLLVEPPAYALASIADLDGIARLAEQDPLAAMQVLPQQLRPVPRHISDWPDLLARDLLRNPCLRLDAWARRHALAPASLARGFRQVFAVSPAALRAELRAQRALALIENRMTSLATVAVEAGFADQAHMTRAVTTLTGRPPGHWLRLNRFKTRQAAPAYKGV